MPVAKHFPVTPEQLPEIKQVAKLIASKVSEKCYQKPLSSFKRLDAMAQGLGYAGGSDMSQSAKHYIQREYVKFHIPAEYWISIARTFAACCSESPKQYLAIYNTVINTLMPYLDRKTDIKTMSFYLGREMENNHMLKKAQ